MTIERNAEYWRKRKAEQRKAAKKKELGGAIDLGEVKVPLEGREGIGLKDAGEEKEEVGKALKPFLEEAVDYVVPPSLVERLPWPYNKGKEARWVLRGDGSQVGRYVPPTEDERVAVEEWMDLQVKRHREERKRWPEGVRVSVGGPA
jgi:hypothetical protein